LAETKSIVREYLSGAIQLSLDTVECRQYNKRIAGTYNTNHFNIRGYIPTLRWTYHETKRKGIAMCVYIRRA